MPGGQRASSLAPLSIQKQLYQPRLRLARPRRVTNQLFKLVECAFSDVNLELMPTKQRLSYWSGGRLSQRKIMSGGPDDTITILVRPWSDDVQGVECSLHSRGNRARSERHVVSISPDLVEELLLVHLRQISVEVRRCLPQIEPSEFGD